MSTLESTPERERRRAEQMSIGEIPGGTYRKWARRAPDHCDVDVAEAWHDAEPVHYPHSLIGAVARYHRESDMILIARQGAITSCYSLMERPRGQRQYVRNQVSDQ